MALNLKAFGTIGGEVEVRGIPHSRKTSEMWGTRLLLLVDNFSLA